MTVLLASVHRTRVVAAPEVAVAADMIAAVAHWHLAVAPCIAMHSGPERGSALLGHPRVQLAAESQDNLLKWLFHDFAHI